jgi:glycerophosphoryl diester phosphodiesterase
MALNFMNKHEHDLEWMTKRAIAHRGLHDASKGIYENTLSAAREAIRHGYNIELDIQPSREMTPLVFHDYELDRLTAEQGKTRDIDAKTLTEITIHDSSDQIPSLEAFLKLVDGQVGLVVEMKGKPGQDDGFVEQTARLLQSYKGDACLMSFDHHLLYDARKFAPDIALGLTAEGDDTDYEKHMKIADECAVDFISYYVKQLDTRFVREFRETGREVISWTVRSPQDKAYSDKFADQITFEGFKP